MLRSARFTILIFHHGCKIWCADTSWLVAANIH